MSDVMGQQTRSEAMLVFYANYLCLNASYIHLHSK